MQYLQYLQEADKYRIAAYEEADKLLRGEDPNEVMTSFGSGPWAWASPVIEGPGGIAWAWTTETDTTLQAVVLHTRCPVCGHWHSYQSGSCQACCRRDNRQLLVSADMRNWEVLTYSFRGEDGEDAMEAWIASRGLERAWFMYPLPECSPIEFGGPEEESS